MRHISGGFVDAGRQRHLARVLILSPSVTSPVTGCVTTYWLLGGLLIWLTVEQSTVRLKLAQSGCQCLYDVVEVKQENSP